MSSSVTVTTLAYISAAAAVAGAGMSIVSGIQNGNAAQAAAGFQKQQLDEQRTMINLQAAQDESARRTHLSKVLGSQRALMAARGVDAEGSDSFAVIQQDTIATAEKDIFNAKLGFMGSLRQNQMASYAADAEGQAGYTAGLMKAGSGFMSGVAGAAGALQKADWGPSKEMVNKPMPGRRPEWD